MKKVLVVLAVLVLASSAVFAGFSVKAGPAYDFINTKYYVEDEFDSTVSASGFGASIEGALDVNEKMEAYLGATVAFPQSYKATNTTVLDVEEKLTIISVTPGVSYGVVNSGAFNLAAGGGLAFNTTYGSYDDSTKIGNTSFGLHAGLAAGFNVSEKVTIGAKGVASALLYHISFVDITSGSTTTSYNKAGFRFGYNLTGSVGVTVKF